MEYIYVKFSNGQVFRIPAKFIATNRAEYYDEKDDTVTFEEEYEYTMSDELELLDWTKAQFNWEDLEDVAEEVPKTQDEDLSELWMTADTEVREVDDEDES